MIGGALPCPAGVLSSRSLRAGPWSQLPFGMSSPGSSHFPGFLPRSWSCLRFASGRISQLHKQEQPKSLGHGDTGLRPPGPKNPGRSETRSGRAAGRGTGPAGPPAGGAGAPAPEPRLLCPASALHVGPHTSAGFAPLLWRLFPASQERSHPPHPRAPSWLSVSRPPPQGLGAAVPGTQGHVAGC